MQDFEKLGVFYLGRTTGASKKEAEHLVLYDSRDLVTHAVCVGMTGSGKTGLCISLIEEAALDGIPAIVIDPKGDLGNLLLTFPELSPGDFRPWVNEEDAARKGISADDLAKQQAELWRSGLASWGEDGARIAKLKSAADFAIYTPGSTAGLPVSILKSFDSPNEATRSDTELLGERVGTTATGLLALLGIDADPIQSREHILLSTILETAWRKGENLDLAALIGRIQKPPVARVGVLDIESFFPAKDRFALAMKLNNLLAAPAFAAWLEGEPLDVAAILRTPGGKPRISIFSIAHLSDAERMFFVTMLLNETVGWMRGQSGTTSLRAIVYMDEIAGYFPPVATPPSKAPLLTLLKQGRAFGLGVVLATQNPVDLDYKGLSNAGTWFLGRLQTERDKARGRGGGRRSEVRPGRNGADPRGPEDTRLPDERRPRGRAGRLRVALGDVLPARATDARADQDADGSPESRGPGCARRGRDGFHRFEEHGSAPGKRRAMPPSPGRSSRLQSPSTSCPSAARGTPGWFTGRRRSALRRCGTPM